MSQSEITSYMCGSYKTTKIILLLGWTVCPFICMLKLQYSTWLYLEMQLLGKEIKVHKCGNLIWELVCLSVCLFLCLCLSLSFPISTQEKRWPSARQRESLWSPALRFPAPKNLRKLICYLNHSVYGTLFWQAELRHTVCHSWKNLNSPWVSSETEF